MDAALFQQLVDAWYDPLYRFALSLSRNGDEALDLTQQTFARWAEKGHGMRDQSKAKSWLFTVLYREFLTSRRSRHRESPPADDQFFDSLASDEISPARSIDGQQVIDTLRAIDEVFRTPLVLFYLENHSYKEIAEILDVPIGTVMSRIARGKEQLRRRLHTQGAGHLAKVVPMPPSTKGKHHG